MTELFTNAWAEAWGQALNQSDAYRQAGKSWEGALVLEAQADPARGLPETAAVYLDLWRGTCREARLATADDALRASYVLTGALGVWLTVLDGEMAPTMAILRGKLKLKRGSLAGLMPHVHAATELVRVARSVVVASPVDSQLADSRDEESHDTEFRDAELVTATADQASTEVPATTTRSRLQSTSPVGLRYDLFPMKLWDKAKRLGIWNPADIDFAQDRRDWELLSEGERDLLLRLAALFQAGEEAVTIDILPLLDVIASEGRLEEQLYLTSFIWEEAKHVEAIRRFLDAVGASGRDLTSYHSPSYRTIFAEALPEAMSRLRTDRSPVAQARASATYNMIVEGVLAETGYHVFHRILTDRGIMPGMQQVAAYLKADESRHLAYGIYLLSRLTVAHGDPVWHAIVERMNALLNPAIAIIGEAFAAYPADAVPFGLTPDPFVQFAMNQFQKRMDRVERARGETMSDVETQAAE